MLIKYHPENERPVPRNASTSLGGVFLSPGDNSLTDKSYLELKQHPDYPKYLEWGAIVDENTLTDSVHVAHPTKTPRAKKQTPLVEEPSNG